MKRFLIIGDRSESILENDFTVLWIGTAKDKEDALSKHEAKHLSNSFDTYKVIEIAKEYELHYDGW